MFEEECRELKWFTEPQKKHLKDAAKALCKVINKHWSMKLIKPSFLIKEQEPGLLGIYRQIEYAGRICYKSSDKITDIFAKEFVDRMVKSGHGAML